MDSLYRDVLFKVFSYLPGDTLARCRSVSKKFKYFADTILEKHQIVLTEKQGYIINKLSHRNNHTLIQTPILFGKTTLCLYLARQTKYSMIIVPSDNMSDWVDLVTQRCVNVLIPHHQYCKRDLDIVNKCLIKNERLPCDIVLISSKQKILKRLIQNMYMYGSRYIICDDCDKEGIYDKVTRLCSNYMKVIGFTSSHEMKPDLCIDDQVYFGKWINDQYRQVWKPTIDGPLRYNLHFVSFRDRFDLDQYIKVINRLNISERRLIFCPNEIYDRSDIPQIPMYPYCKMKLTNIDNVILICPSYLYWNGSGGKKLSSEIIDELVDRLIKHDVKVDVICPDDPQIYVGTIMSLLSNDVHTEFSKEIGVKRPMLEFTSERWKLCKRIQLNFLDFYLLFSDMSKKRGIGLHNVMNDLTS